MPWLEESLSELLTKSLGAFVKGIDKESLGISVWSGDVRLKKLELKTEAFEALDLPMRVVGGTLGEIRIKVPWRNLGKAPLIVSLDRLFLLLAPKDASKWSEKDERERVARTKREQLEAWEAVETRGKQAGLKWEERLTAALLQKLEVHISNAHVRLEVADEHGGAAFGAVLPALRVSDIAPDARSVERSGSRWSLVSAAAQLLVRKCVSISGLAAYLTEPQADDGEGGRRPGEEPADEAALDTLMMPMLTTAVAEPSHVLQPLHASLSAVFDPSDRPSLEWPQWAVELSMESEVGLALRHSQYLALLRLTEAVARSERQYRFRACRRPSQRPAVAPREWWGYAQRGVLERLRTTGIRFV